MTPATSSVSKPPLNTELHYTKEERRVELYNGNDVPTDPRFVNEDTDLETLV